MHSSAKCPYNKSKDGPPSNIAYHGKHGKPNDDDSSNDSDSENESVNSDGPGECNYMVTHDEKDSDDDLENEEDEFFLFMKQVADLKLPVQDNEWAHAIVWKLKCIEITAISRFV